LAAVDIDKVVTELRAIERRYAPAAGPSAAAYAEQLAEWRTREPDSEEVCWGGDATGAWVVVMLCARYGIRPFRRPRQKATTVSVLAPAGFVSKVFWPQALEMMGAFERARRAMADEVVTVWLGAAGDEAFVVDEKPGR
jgi:hypothetical protein